jgi:membrane fusion protein, heavy metal efflux system
MNTSADPIVVGAAPAASRSEAFKPGVARRLLGKVPALMVFVLLGGLWWWGHATDWTLPKFSALLGHVQGEHEDWCSEHNVPESKCVECNPKLLPRGKIFGWCKIHNVHECPLCHPEVAAARQESHAADHEHEHDGNCSLHERRIQFVSQEAVERAGIEVATVGTAAVTETVTGSGEIAYDQTRTARLSTRVPGTIFQVGKQVGDAVKQGEVLALVDAAEVGRAKAEFLQALTQVRLRGRNFERLSGLLATGAVPERSLRETETGLAESRIRLTTAQQALTNLGLPIQSESLATVPDELLVDRLRFLGLPKTLSGGLDAKTPGNLLPVTAPFDGVVVSRDVVAGEVVDAAKVLYVVVDLRQMWLNLDLPLEDAKRVARGQSVRFLPDGGGEAVGTITWISTEADPKTRTIKIRVALDNADGRLRANTFGTGKVTVCKERQVVVVPNSAVQWMGCCNVVFVRDKNFLKPDALKVFHVRTICLGTKGEQQTEIRAGVAPGDVVATAGSSLLRAELLKTNLGEGCACCKN